MTRLMATWVILAALATIAITAVLTGVLYQMNAPAMKRIREAGDSGPTAADPVSSKADDATDSGGDGGGD